MDTNRWRWFVFKGGADIKRLLRAADPLEHGMEDDEGMARESALTALERLAAKKK